jgi:hypothetical protein
VDLAEPSDFLIAACSSPSSLASAAEGSER